MYPPRDNWFIALATYTEYAYDTKGGDGGIDGASTYLLSLVSFPA